MYHTQPEGVSVHTGFPNPATDASLQVLDLNPMLIKNPISTYIMRVRGTSWRSMGIFAGDLVIIDRALKPKPNDLVVWFADSEFSLSPCHSLPTGAYVWGVVTATIHQYKKPAKQRHGT